MEALKKSAAEEEIRLPWKERENIIVSMGREDDVKGFWHLLKSFYLVKKEVSDARLMIIGDGEFEEYKVLAKELGVAEELYFTGMKKNPFPYLSAARVYVLTSYHEGFPNALIEAMALGVPVIATDCLTGPREILRKENVAYGILIPNMNPEKNLKASEISEEEAGLAEEIKRMLTDEEYRKHYQKAAVARSKDFSDAYYVECIMKWIG